MSKLSINKSKSKKVKMNVKIIDICLILAKMENGLFLPWWKSCRFHLVSSNDSM